MSMNLRNYLKTNIMKTLISMTAFVLEKSRFEEDSDTAIFKITNYANFINQPLTLGMFVPCDLEGNVLKEPEFNDTRYSSLFFITNEKYREAKERVLFEGFEVKKYQDSENILDLFLMGDKYFFYYSKENGFHSNHNNIENPKRIENLIFTNLTLTPNAIKELNL